MENIEITFLGTGSAIPTLSRNHNAIWLKYKEKVFLIDCGEGTQRQIRKAKLNACKITDILITHTHGDHMLGLPGLLHTMGKSGYNKEINIYCPKGAKKIIDQFLKITNVHDVKYNVKEVNGKFIDNKYFEISSYKLNHEVPVNGYRFVEKDRLRVNKSKISKLKLSGKIVGELANGKNIKHEGKTIKYKDVTTKELGRTIGFVFDTKLCPNVNKIISKADLGIMEAVFLASSSEGKEMAKKYMHLTIEDSTRTAKKEGVKELILTHISQRYEFKDDLILKEAKKIFKNVKVAKDLMKVSL